MLRMENRNKKLNSVEKVSVEVFAYRKDTNMSQKKSLEQ